MYKSLDGSECNVITEEIIVAEKLHLSDMGLPFIIEADASDIAVRQF